MNGTTAGDGAAIQRRSIDITTFESDDSHIVVCGELRDRRLVPTTDLQGNPRAAGTVHLLRIRMKVAVGSLTIVEIEADMPHTPHRECAEMHRSVESIRGMTLSRGFSSRVKGKLGGRSGCIHLTTLLLAMAPAALQGYWVHNDRRPKRRRISANHLKQYLIDTCRVWRREGPLVNRIAREAGIDLSETSGRTKTIDSS